MTTNELPLRLFLSSYPMAQKYNDLLTYYFDHLGQAWEDQCHLIGAGDAFKESGGKFNKWVGWASGKAEGYDTFRFQEFIVPEENTVLDAFLEADDPRRDQPHAGGLNALRVDEAGGSYVRVGKMTGGICLNALATGRRVGVIGNGFDRVRTVSRIEEQAESYITARGNERTMQVFWLYVD